MKDPVNLKINYVELSDILKPEQDIHHFVDDIYKKDFIERTSFYFDYNFTECCSSRPDKQLVNIGSDNGLMSNR